MRSASRESQSNAAGSRGGRRAILACIAACLAILCAGLVSIGAWAEPERPSQEPERYSAYADPEKPVISFLLSDPGNVEDFKKEFGLGDAEVEDVLAATRKENEALAKTYAESEKLLDARSELSKSGKQREIEESSYEEEVRAAVGETKGRVEDALPDGEESADRLETWVDERWGEAVGRYNSEVAAEATRSASFTAKTCRVYATQYYGYTRNEVALPHRLLKFRGGYEVRLTRRVKNGRTYRDWAPVREVGPWNTYDNYWRSPADRDMWRNLRRCVPEAQAAYYDNYNGGRDEFGRKVLNPAGVDLTPYVARQLGLRLYQNAWISVYYPWVRR